MKFAYTVAAPDGSAPGLALHGDFRRDLDAVRTAGFDGVELYVRDPSRLDPERLARQIADAGLQMPAVCTGEVYGTDGLALSSADAAVRRAALGRTRAIIELASRWGAPVNIGRLRGPLPPDPDGRRAAEQRAADAFQALADTAAAAGTAVVLEPINKHEINFINTTAEGIAWMRRIGHPAFAIMLDVYHVALEDPSVPAAFVTAGRAGGLRHVHLCDGNRLAPGWGSLNLKDVLATLRAMDYRAWITVECLQRPNGAAAVAQSGRYLQTLVTSLGLEASTNSAGV